MTDYVTEMMKTAGCKTHPRGCTNDDVNEYTGYISNDCEGDCEDCTWYDPDEYYPDFTAEKQLEIITLIGLERGFKIIPNEGYDYMLSEDTYAKYELNKQGYSMTDFTQALAQLTTELMNADELDKKKVMEILQ